MTLSFAALDVETANRSRGSVCSIGIAVIEAGHLVAQHHMLCKPPETLHWFDGINVSIHGIRPEDVADQPTFAVRLQQTLEIVGDLPVVAHNAAFDIGAIRTGCDADGVDWPTLNYACSLVMARRSSLGLLSYRLPLVCEALGVAQGQHHRADEDAAAAAMVVLALAGRARVDNLADLAASLMVRLGRISQVDWAGCVSSRRLHPPSPNADADPDHPFYGQEVAFTGGLSILRAEAMALVANLGGTPQAGPTKITDFLVIGDGFTGNSAAEFHTGKAAKAVKINSKGGRIEVLTEGDFLALVADTRTQGSRVPDQRQPRAHAPAAVLRAAPRQG
jgi:DNA polymerase-3 subunit epsilon